MLDNNIGLKKDQKLYFNKSKRMQNGTYTRLYEAKKNVGRTFLFIWNFDSWHEPTLKAHHDAIG